MKGRQGEFLLFLALVELLNLLEVLHDVIPLNYFLFINPFKSTKWSRKLGRWIMLHHVSFILKLHEGSTVFLSYFFFIPFDRLVFLRPFYLEVFLLRLA